MDNNLEVKCLKTKGDSFINNCYIVHNFRNNHLILFDPAWDIDVFKNYVQGHNSIVDGIFLTHYHYDHTNIADELAGIFECPIFLEKREAETDFFVSENLMEFTAPGVIKTSTCTINCLSTPGHSLSGVSYLIDEMIFTGDVLFNEGCGFPDEDYLAIDLFNSIQLIKKLTNDDTVVYPGHSYGTSPGATMKEISKMNIYLNLKEFKEFKYYIFMKNNHKRNKFT